VDTPGEEMPSEEMPGEEMPDAQPPPPVAREGFLGALATALTVAQGAGDCLGLVLVDLHNLRRINHRCGYAEGDRLLRCMQAELLGLSKLPDAVFRVAGHGFAFILPGLPNPGFIALAVHRIQQVLEEALRVEEAREPAQLRLGLAVAGPGDYDREPLLIAAEANLAQARLAGSLVMESLVDPGERGATAPTLEQQFLDALHNNDFELHYQPKVDLASGAVQGAEALLRWHLEGEGAVAPQRVVSLAEHEGKLFELSKWVVHRALRQLQQWGADYRHSLSVNLPAGMVNHPDLVNTLHDALRIWGVAPWRLILEITEDAVIEDKEAGFHTLQELLELGVGLSIDDFGTGYSSLSYFQHIPAGELKIDKSFVTGMLARPRDEELVRIIIEIAHLFDLKVVAEGVEDRVTLEALRALGCDTVQGYIYTRPLPAGEFLAWLAARKHSGAAARAPGSVATEGSR
jgi:diguanylate cyclase (GGDEF)-like protein